MKHRGSRLFITGIPTAGKSYLAKSLAEQTGGIAVLLDDVREDLASDPRYKEWVNFYLDRDEKEYLTNTSSQKRWRDLVLQSEAIWPALLKEIESYANEERPVIFECVNILPHLAKRDLDFPGICLIGTSFEETLKRNMKDPRWGATEELQKLEAEHFFSAERPAYEKEALAYGYLVFKTADEAMNTALSCLSKSSK
jgi:hypothetical protein